MKQFNRPVALKAMIGVALSINFILYPQLRVSAAEALRVSIDVKTESQYKSEATLCDSALRAIAGVATMKLATPDDLKQAVAVLDRARPNLKLYRSKLILLALTDPVFSGAIKKKASDKEAAEAFLKQLTADPKLVLKLDGADSLKVKLEQTARTDAAILQQASEHLKQAAESIKKTGHLRTMPGPTPGGEVRLVRAAWATEQAIIADGHMTVSPQDPITIAVGILFAIYVAAVATFVFALFGAVIGAAIDRLLTTQDKDALADCQRDADRDYNDCVNHANQQFFPINVLEAAACYASWLSRQKDCLLEF